MCTSRLSQELATWRRPTVCSLRAHASTSSYTLHLRFPQNLPLLDKGSVRRVLGVELVLRCQGLGPRNLSRRTSIGIIAVVAALTCVVTHKELVHGEIRGVSIASIGLTVAILIFIVVVIVNVLPALHGLALHCLALLHK